MKRWIIRTFFIGLLLLFAGGWVGSYKYGWEVGYRNNNTWVLEVNRGRIDLDWWDSFNIHEEQGWYGRSAYAQVPINYDHLGFFWMNEAGIIWLSIPFWFPTTVSAALLWWVWRKTRPKPVGRAFPVELAKASEQKGGKGE
jgi:hypothetical protein